MKIKTITCHDVYNFGATLQAFALSKYLEGLGHDVEIIDYKPEYLSKRYDLWFIGEKWKSRGFFIKSVYYACKIPIRLLTNVGKYRFDAFKRSNMKVTAKTYHDCSELRASPPSADVYIAGSDQIWNVDYENGKDPAFYLDFGSEKVKRISYAASFSNSEMLPEYKNFVKKMLSHFDHISIRESVGLNILSSMNIDNGRHVLDPVFLLSKEEWMKFVEPRPSEKYILVYDFDKNTKIERFVREVAKREHLKIYGINNYQRTPYVDIDFFHGGPKTFLSLVNHAEFVVSNSFHATAFSIIFEKNFLVFDRIQSRGNTRMRDLLKTCNLSERLIGDDIEGIAFSDIDYDEVRGRVGKYIERSKAFLNTSLN